jgi:hypothetical protein
MKVSEYITPVKNPVDLRLRRIADILLLNGSLAANPGLFNGKMGIAIFLYHFARKTRNALYDSYAGELIDEIYKEINSQSPVGFANGLTGLAGLGLGLMKPKPGAKRRKGEMRNLTMNGKM